MPNVTDVQVPFAPQSFLNDSRNGTAIPLRPNEEAFMAILILAIFAWGVLPTVFGFIGTLFSPPKPMKDEMGDIDPQLLSNEGGREDSDDYYNRVEVTVKANTLQKPVTPQEKSSRQDEPLRNIQRNWNSPSTQARLQAWERKKLLEQREYGREKGFEAIGRWEQDLKRREEKLIKVGLKALKQWDEAGKEVDEVDDGRIVLWVPGMEGK
ncbi:hypothetical protein OEA41_001411 [Lepraria neglecta]|uniref:Uncharacterized protein n=1 Tax=Lepraria neglecta TaxID=209136 RepID=A0AAE0DLF4_9LECA|nr:hypothetical protein OEA41_001411 [Lepraria neglecta]